MQYNLAIYNNLSVIIICIVYYNMQKVAKQEEKFYETPADEYTQATMSSQMMSGKELATVSYTGDTFNILSESQYTHVHRLFNVTVVLLYTGIVDLADVKRLLKNFSDWLSLGLELGLLYPTLERIEGEHQRVISRCKTAMLAAWLQQQDNVYGKGVPSWSTLKTALINIEEYELADQITMMVS